MVRHHFDEIQPNCFIVNEIKRNAAAICINLLIHIRIVVLKLIIISTLLGSQKNSGCATSCGEQVKWSQ